MPKEWITVTIAEWISKTIKKQKVKIEAWVLISRIDRIYMLHTMMMPFRRDIVNSQDLRGQQQLKILIWILEMEVSIVMIWMGKILWLSGNSLNWDRRLMWGVRLLVNFRENGLMKIQDNCNLGTIYYNKNRR